MILTKDSEPQSKIERAIRTKLHDGVFRPNREFYAKIGIGQRRFGQLVRGEKPANLDELQSLADYFGVDFKEMI